MLSREEAIATLQSAAGIAPDGKAPPRRPSPTRGLRIGELMVMANIVTPAEVLDSLERALVNQELIGAVLIEQVL